MFWNNFASLLILSKPQNIRGIRHIFIPTEEEQKHLGVQFDHWDIQQNNPHHNLSVWDHTIEALDHLTRNTNKNISDEERIIRNLSMILHDIGKCDICTRQIREDGYYTYSGHADSSAKITRTVLNRLEAPAHIIERVSLLTAEHMRLFPDKLSKKALRRFIKDLGNDWVNSLEISNADNKGKVNYDPGIDEKFNKLYAEMKELEKNQQPEPINKRPVNGYDLINLGVPPGVYMGQLFKQLDEKLLDNPDMNKEEALELIRALMALRSSS